RSVGGVQTTKNIVLDAEAQNDIYMSLRIDRRDGTTSAPTASIGLIQAGGDVHITIDDSRYGTGSISAGSFRVDRYTPDSVPSLTVAPATTCPGGVTCKTVVSHFWPDPAAAVNDAWVVFAYGTAGAANTVGSAYVF